MDIASRGSIRFKADSAGEANAHHPLYIKKPLKT